MPLFNKFPYTNFHELNLDWILEQIPLFQKMRDETEGFRNETEELKHDTEHLRDETKVLHDDTKDLHDAVVEEHKQVTTEITQAKNDITNTVNTGKNEINTLVTNGTQQIDTLITTGKNDINTLVTNGTNQLDTLIDTGKQDITTMVDSGKTAIDTATTTGREDIANATSEGVTTLTGEKDKALTAITSSKDSAVQAIQAQETSTVTAVTGEGAKQVKAVTDEANAKITEITTKGDEYTTTMTDLFTNTKYHADNAKASEAKAQEYSEIAKTLKPLYWGGDLENLHQTLDVKAECENAVDKSSTTRWCNLLILKNATNSPDNTKEWQCKVTPVTSSKANLLAWNSEGAMYVGTYDATATDITWMNTVNLDELYADVTGMINTTNEKVSALEKIHTRTGYFKIDSSATPTATLLYTDSSGVEQTKSVTLKTLVGSVAFYGSLDFTEINTKPLNVYVSLTAVLNPLDAPIDSDTAKLKITVAPSVVEGNTGTPPILTVFTNTQWYNVIGMTSKGIASVNHFGIMANNSACNIVVSLSLFDKQNIEVRASGYVKVSNY